MRATRPTSSIVSQSALAALLALAGCSSPAPTTDAAVVAPDTGTPPPNDTGVRPDAFMRVDAGPLPLCTGAGCDLVGLELMGESSCVIRANGQVDCWGRGQNGELGDGAMRHSDNCRLTAGEPDTDCSRAAVTVRLPAPAESITSRGSYQMCALLTGSGEAWCWGSQHYRLGSQLEHDRFDPEHVMIGSTAIADGTAQIATSFANLCFIASDTTVQCVGSGRSGVLGDGTFNDATMPVTALMADGTTPLTGVLEVDTQGGHTCARTATHLYCWGNNHYNQLGVAPPHQTCVASPTMYDCSYVALEVTGVDATTVVDIQLGDDFSCVLHSTGHVQCWGGGQTGGLGTGDINSTVAPVEPMGLSSVDELRVVDGNACALRHDGSVWCWGPADVGQIGDGSMVHTTTPCINGAGAPYDCQLTPTQVTGVSGVSHIGVGGGHACALTTTGEVWCWGQSLRYQLGDAMRAMPSFSPVRVIALGS